MNLTKFLIVLSASAIVACLVVWALHLSPSAAFMAGTLIGMIGMMASTDWVSKPW